MFILSHMGDCIFALEKPLKVVERKTGIYDFVLIYDDVIVGKFKKYVDAVGVITKLVRAIEDGDKVFEIPYEVPTMKAKS